MKKYISILSLLCITAFTACETTVTMDGSAGARVDAVIDSYYEVLAGAENGWIADVPTSEGIYRFHMAFTADNMVTMYTDNLYYEEEYKGIPETSTYNIRSMQRPTLSFDTYCYLAIINDPDDSISHGSGNQGLETDFEFEVDHLSDDGVFYLTGRVNRVAATLRPATAEELASVKEGRLMDALNNATAYNAGKFNSFSVGDTKVGYWFTSRVIYFSYYEGDKPVVVSRNTRTQLNYNVELIEPIEIAGSVVSGFNWNGSSFSAVVGESEVPVVALDEAVIPLHKMLGPGKNFSILASLLDMYPSTDASVNQFGYRYSRDNETLVARFGGLSQVNLEFYNTEAGAPRMSMTVSFGGYQGAFTYYLEYNTEMDQFKVTKMTFEDDAVGNGQVIYSSFGTRNLADFWTGKTFKIELAPKMYSSYLMGQIVLVGGTAPAEFYGACLE